MRTQGRVRAQASIEQQYKGKEYQAKTIQAHASISDHTIAFTIRLAILKVLIIHKYLGLPWLSDVAYTTCRYQS